MSNADRFTPVKLEANSVVYKTCAETRCRHFRKGAPSAIGHVLRNGDYPVARIGNCTANEDDKYPILDETVSACNRFVPTEQISIR